MEDARGKAGIRPAFCKSLVKVLEVPHPSACNHRDPDGVRDGRRDRDIEPGLCAVRLHACEQDLACSPLFGFLRP
ncbi:hypothetical protein ASZ90_010198 [hydrocarbon metagenome]|uniref:Uncharacterized protein n=1 Tax=hydrocarbon metagenome TaxID=938273 RepID=A0A0W8FGN4_9ZZZZ